MINSRGVSIMEILVGVAIFAVAGSILAGTLISTNDVFLNQNAQVNQGLSLNQTVAEMSDVIKSSAGVVSQYPASGVAQYTTGANVLVLRVPGVSAGEMVLDSVYDYVVLGAEPGSSKILKKKIFTTSPSVRNEENKVLSTSLKNLQFSYLDANNNIVPPAQAVRVAFIVNLLEGGSENESSASGSINLKNIQ